RATCDGGHSYRDQNRGMLLKRDTEAPPAFNRILQLPKRAGPTLSREITKGGLPAPCFFSLKRLQERVGRRLDDEQKHKHKHKHKHKQETDPCDHSQDGKIIGHYIFRSRKSAACSC